jgi:Zn-dependent M28 family amino/carboxypeptidase
VSAAVAEADPLSATALMADVTWLAAPEQRGRGSATEDEERAAVWLSAALERAGVPPLAERAYLHPFALKDGRRSRNVVGVITPAAPRDDRVIVLGAHLDHVGLQGGVLHPGADDNASGVAVALGVARHLARHPDALERRLVIVFFGAEEVGLLGSWAFVRTPTVPLERIEAIVALDMLGRPLVDQPPLRLAANLLGIDAPRSVGVDGLRGRPWLEAIVREACSAEGHTAVTIDDLPEIVRSAATRISRGRSDHFPFE